MDDIEAFLTIYIGTDLSTGFEKANSLPHYINAYCKGKSLDDLTLAHILTPKDINQSVHCVLAVISDNEEKFFDRSTLELLCTVLYQHGYPIEGYTEWAAESLTFIKAHVTTIHDTLIIMIIYGS